MPVLPNDLGIALRVAALVILGVLNVAILIWHAHVDSQAWVHYRGLALPAR